MLASIISDQVGVYPIQANVLLSKPQATKPTNTGILPLRMPHISGDPGVSHRYPPTSLAGKAKTTPGGLAFIDAAHRIDTRRRHASLTSA